jgi:hypothetical protein
MKFTAICGGLNVEGVGRYRWRLKGKALHLDLMDATSAAAAARSSKTPPTSAAAIRG